MSDLDSLLLTFQTQFSVVMETVLKTAMYEVTRLVEDGFIEEVRRRDQKVDSLRTQLQWATSRRGRCIDCGKVDIEMSPPSDTPTELQYGVLGGCDLKQEDGSMDRWAGGGAQEVTSEAAQEADESMAILGPDDELGAIDEESVRARLDLKEEDVLKQSCSIEHSGGWALSRDGGVGSESSSFGENNETAQRNNEEILRAVMKQDLQTFGLADVLEDTGSPSPDETEASGDIDCQRATLSLMKTGLIQTQSLGSSKECESAVIRSSPQQISHEPEDPIVDVLRAAAHGNLPLVQCSSSESPNTRPQVSDAGSVMVKEEIILDSDEGEEEEDVMEEKATSRGMTPSSRSMNQYRLRQEVLRHKHISRKQAVHEGIKLHSKAGTSLSLEAATPHSHQPIRKLPHIPTTNTSTAPSMTRSQPANFHPLNRTPSISKAIPPLPVSLQRAHLSDKRPAALSRAGVPWVSVKAHHQAANSFHPHPSSHPHPGPRHLLRCGQCGKCFPHPSNLKAHQQTHTGERPFCCSLCGRSFTKLSNLKAHRRVHTGERPYCCAACGKRFTQKCNLKRHQRIHLDV